MKETPAGPKLGPTHPTIQETKSPPPFSAHQSTAYRSQGTGFPTLQQTYLFKEVLLHGPGVVTRQRWLDFPEIVCIPSCQHGRHFPNEMGRPQTVTSCIIKQHTVARKALATLYVVDITTLPKG